MPEMPGSGHLVGAWATSWKGLAGSHWRSKKQVGGAFLPHHPRHLLDAYYSEL